MTRARGVVLLATLQHTVWGLTDLFTNIHAVTAPTYVLTRLVGGGRLEGLFYLGVAGMAAIGMNSRSISTKLKMLAPQQFSLLLSAAGSLMSVLLNHYPDGTTRPWPFILNDQAANILLALLYTWAMQKEATWTAHH
jgi:hypothetical protein